MAKTKRTPKRGPGRPKGSPNKKGKKRKKSKLDEDEFYIDSILDDRLVCLGTVVLPSRSEDLLSEKNCAQRKLKKKKPHCATLYKRAHILNPRFFFNFFDCCN